MISKKISWAVVAGMCCFATSVFADTAAMQLTSAGNYTLGGVYVGPYTATINGVSTAVICDDFLDDSYLPEYWTADVYTPPNYTTTRDATTPKITDLTGTALTQAYNEVGYLADELLAAAASSTPDGTTIGEIHFALWSVFDPGAMNYLSGSVQTAAQGYLTAAQGFANDSSYISQFTIYSPNLSSPITCSAQGAACAATPPQEFLVKTPEPSELALMGIDFSGVGGLIFLFYRRRNRRA